MPTKTQAKAAVNAAGTDINSDIDNILPAGVNIKDGSVGFNPESYVITLDAGNNAATATTWAAAIQTALTAANRTSVLFRTDRRADDVGRRSLVVKETGANPRLTVVILNF